MTQAAPFLVWLGVALFGLGFLGLLLRRNLIVLLMCVELMLNGANLVLVTYSRLWGNLDGQILAFVVIAVAAAEVGIGFGIVLSLFRRRDSLDISRFRQLRH